MINPDDLSEFDILQLDRLAQKARHEGSLVYAVENWPWPFDNDILAEADRVMAADVLRAAINATAERRVQWWREHPHPTQIAPLDAHDEESERRAAALVLATAPDAAGLVDAPRPAVSQ